LSCKSDDHNAPITMLHARTLEAQDNPSCATSERLPPALVRFVGVQKSYDGLHLVVRQLDLDIRRGEFLTLLGPSGSGKTTTLMMLAGFESPTAGEILLDGKPITRTPPHRRNFGMVFQNYALFPHLTVGQNVAYPLTVRKTPKPEQATRVAKALDMVRLSGMADRFPAQLSGGQQQRVALARALVFEPQLVLMDEPLGALDKQLREHMQIELKELHRQLGVTFVFVTHDQGEALTMSDRVAVFDDGAIQQVDTADRMYEAPANRFVAGFIGDNTTLRGTVCAVQSDPGTDRCDIVLADGRVLIGMNVNGAAVGAAVEACIRPERIAIQPDTRAESVPGRANMLPAQVRGVIYFGDHLRLLCAVGDGQPHATVKLPLSVPYVPETGHRIWLEFPTEFTRIYV
jgi:putative spermidine/putrescine transport system ATP-binding protein